MPRQRLPAARPFRGSRSARAGSGIIIVIVGGLGSLTGALLGGVLIGLSEALAALVISPALKTTFSYALLVLVLLLRPNGLFGEPDR